MAIRSFINVVVATRQPVAFNTKHVAARYPHVVEEHLVELHFPSHLEERSNSDAVRLHVHHELRQPEVLRHVRIGPGEQQSVSRQVTEARPDLLAVHDPVVTITDRAARYPRDVGAMRRLGEQLTPDVFAGEDIEAPH
jgi:hypothetical protein